MGNMIFAVDKLPHKTGGFLRRNNAGPGRFPEAMEVRATHAHEKRAFLALAAALALAGCTQAGRQAPDPFSATGELIALSGGRSGARNACFTCHGLDGGGNGAGAPRIAGLGLGYLDRQLEGYASGRRRHPEMEFIARRLSASDRQQVAAYYAAMPSTAPGGGRPHAPQPLYVRGDAGRGLAPCAACHGEDGAGVGFGNPPLAGQPAAYLEAQLRAWRFGKRRNDPGNMMLAISKQMTEEEIRSVSAYAAALPGASPRREYPEASRAARRVDSRNGASARPLRGGERARSR